MLRSSSKGIFHACLHSQRDVDRIACKQCVFERTTVQHFDTLMLPVQSLLGGVLIAAPLASLNGLCFAVLMYHKGYLGRAEIETGGRDLG